jgi:hypothetical protein
MHRHIRPKLCNLTTRITGFGALSANSGLLMVYTHPPGVPHKNVGEPGTYLVLWGLEKCRALKRVLEDARFRYGLLVIWLLISRVLHEGTAVLLN